MWACPPSTIATDHLAHPRRTEKQHVGRLSHEGQLRQLSHLPLVDGGLEAEVEVLQRLVKGQVRQTGPRLQVALPPGRRLDGQQIRQKLGVGDLPVRRLLQALVQHRGGTVQPEAFEIMAGLLKGDHGRSPP